MTFAAFLIALGASVLVISALSLLWGTVLEVFGGNPLTGRYGDDPLENPEEAEVHHMSAS